MIKIPLTQDKVALVDDVDSDLADLKWYANYHDNNWYARRNQSTRGGVKSKTIRMHRVVAERILGRPIMRGEITDHINRNGLDNRRSNLRVVNAKISALNRRKFAQFGGKLTHSKYRGVTWNRGKWQAQIRVDGKTHHLGYFMCEADAANAYDNAAKRFSGDDAELNTIPCVRASA